MKGEGREEIVQPRAVSFNLCITDSSDDVSVLLCSETYQYYILPFCEPETKEYRSEGLGQLLAGDRAVNSLYQLPFGEDSPKITLCSKTLSPDDVSKFRNAVANEYYFQVCSL